MDTPYDGLGVTHLFKHFWLWWYHPFKHPHVISSQPSKWRNRPTYYSWRGKVPGLPMIIERCILHTSSLPFIRRKLNTRLMYHLVPRCIDDQTRLWSCKVCHDTHRWHDVLIRYIVQELDVEVVDVVVIEQEGLVVKLNSVANTETLIMSELTRLGSKGKNSRNKS